MAEIAMALESFLNKEFFVLILVGGVIFSMSVTKRKYFILRLACGILFGFVMSTIMRLIVSSIFPIMEIKQVVGFEIIRAGVEFGLATLIIFILYEYQFLHALYVAVLGYALEHMLVLLSYGLSYYFWADKPTIKTAVYFGLCLIFYVAEYLLIKNKGISFSIMDNHILVFQSAVFLFGAIVLSVLSYYYIVSDDALVHTPTVFIVSTFGMLICGNIVIGLLDILKIYSVEQELLRTRELWQEDVKQYKISRETSELLNMRYHDLKKRMEILLQDPQAIGEIKEALNEYDCGVRTGNEAMDVVLTEKKLRCQRSDIDLTVIADGTCLQCLGPVETYTVLGNLLDNAMEYLEGVADVEKRLIQLSIRHEGEMDVIQIENYLKEPLHWDADLPVTTKADARIHGYGLKSVEHTLSQHGGYMRIADKNRIFSVIAILPSQAVGFVIKDANIG